MSLSAIIRRSPGTVWLGAAQHVTFVGGEHVSMGTWTIVFRGIQERRSTFVLQPQARFRHCRTLIARWVLVFFNEGWVLRRICVPRGSAGGLQARGVLRLCLADPQKVSGVPRMRRLE